MERLTGARMSRSWVLALLVALIVLPPAAAGQPRRRRTPAPRGRGLEIETTYVRAHSRRTALVPARCAGRVRELRRDQARISRASGCAPASTGRWQPVALTFDTEIPHGAEAHWTLANVLDVLQLAGVRATFFVVGRWARANPELLRRLVTEGHEVANHSLTHRRFTAGRPADELRDELDTVAEIVRRETGAEIAPLFRPPYGCIDERAAGLAREQGYRLIGWTASGGDARSTTTNPADVVATVDTYLRHGGIILLHTNRWLTAAALPEILVRLRARRLLPVTVSELLALESSSADLRLASALRVCGSGLAHAGRGGRDS